MTTATAEPFGKEKWSLRTAGTIFVRPTIGPDLIFIGSEVGAFYAIDKDSGRVRWRTQVGGVLTATAVLDDGGLFVATDSAVNRLDPGDGATIWTTPLHRDVVGDIGAIDGLVVVASNPDVELGDDPGPGNLMAFDESDGTVRWTRELASTVGRPCFTGDLVVVGTRDGTLVVIDSEGTVRAQFDLGESISQSPHVEEGTIYVGAGTTLHALDFETGTPLWTVEGDDPITAAPATDASSVYVAFDHALWAIDRADAARRFDAGLHLPRWIHETSARIGSVTPHAGLVYLTSLIMPMLETGEHEMLAVDQGTGQLYWRRGFGDTLYAAPSTEGDRLYIGNRNHRLYALNIEQSGLSPARSAEVWNEIGLVHVDDGDDTKAIEAFLQSIDLDPVLTDAYRNLADVHFAQNRIALGLEVLQRLVRVVSGQEREDVELEIASRTGLLWTHPTTRLLPLSMFPLLGAPDPDEADTSPITPSPTVVDDLVLVGTPDGELLAVDAQSGGSRWSFPTGERSIRSTPVADHGVVYFGAGNGQIYSVDLASGEERWRHDTGARVDSTPALAGGLLFVGSDDGNVYALDAANGQLAWRFQTGGRVKSSPVVDGNRVFVGSYDGSLRALDVEGGELWSFATDNIINSSPCVADGLVVLGPDDNTVYAIDAATGQQRWAYRVQESAPSILRHGISDGGGLSTLGFAPSDAIVVDGTVYVGSHGRSHCQLYAIDLLSGKLRWRAPVPNGELGSPVMAGGVVFVGSGAILFHDEHIHAFDATDGSLLWRFCTDGDVLSAPAVDADRMYAWSMGGALSAFDIGPVAESTALRDSDFFVRRSEVHVENGELDEALVALRDAIGLDEGSTKAQARLADLYEKIGEKDKQRETLEQLQRAAPASTDTYWRLGLLHLGEGRADEAIEQLSEYLLMLSDESNEPVAYYSLANAYFAKGEEEQGLHALDRAIETGAPFVSPSYGTDVDSKHALTMALAAMALKAQRLMSTDVSVRKSFDLDLLFDATAVIEDSTSRSVVLSAIAIQEGDYDQAVTWLEAALEDGSGPPEILGMLADVRHNRQKRFDRSYPVFRELARQSPDPSSLANLAEAALATGRYDEAAELVQQVLDQTDDPAMRANAQLIATTVSLLTGHDKAAAVERLDAALADLPDDAAGWEYGALQTYLARDADADADTRSIVTAAVDVLEGRMPPEAFVASVPRGFASPTGEDDDPS